MPSNISPYTINVSEEKLNRLKQRLALSEFPEEIADAEPWSRGPPLSDVKRLAEYWANGLDWRKVEADLNKLPHFMATLEVDHFGSYDVHFIHQKSDVKNAIPLLFLHGWPGSFMEVTKLLSPLAAGGDEFPAFHVVAPSLVDFGFSSANRKKSFSISEHAELYNKLMLSLGYNEYVVQAGDVGSLVARQIAIKYSNNCKAHHLNSVVPAEPTAESHPELHKRIQETPLSPSELAGLQRMQQFSTEGMGYLRIQSTKPQTVSFSMSDSPVGFLAWMYEKLHDWTDNYPWTDDEILTWISIYYFSTAGPGAPNSLYYEMDHGSPSAFVAAQAYSDVPLGIARLPKDLMLLPNLWAHTMGPVVLQREYESGGHFAAWERPGEVVDDLRSMFGKDGGAFGCVPGTTGYN